MLKIRLIRLWPVMAIGAVLGFVVTACHIGPPIVIPLPLALARGLAFWPTALPHVSFFPLDAVEWSLLYELAANLIHALVVRWLSVKVLLGVVAVSLIGLVTTAAQIHAVSGGWGSETALQGVFRVGFSYPVGLLLLRLHRAQRLPTIKAPAALVMLAVPVACSIPQLPFPASSILGDLFAVVVVFPLLVVIAIPIQMTGRAATGAKFGGEASYPFYAIHTPLARAFYALTGALALSHVVHLALWAMFAVVVTGLSWLVFVFIDQPVRTWLTGLWGKPPPAPATTAS